MSARELLICAALVSALITDASAQSPRADAGLARVGEANRDARQGPSTTSFERARQVHAYEPGAIYELYANPAFVTAILLEPGEQLAEAAAGDTSRWMVTQANSQSEGAQRTIVLLRPNASGLRTNLVLITDRRVYLIEASSQAGRIYSAEMAWTYPATSAAAPLQSAALNAGYRMRTISGRRPSWTPTRVVDDGARTWIEFAPEVRAGDLPPIFVLGAEGPELVNYRTIEGEGGPRYVVDRVFDVAELRLGARSPTIVRIERLGAPRVTPRPRRRP